MMVFLKALTLCVELALISFLLNLWRDGREVAALRGKGADADLALQRHRYSLAGAVVCAVGAVVLVEAQVMMSEARLPYSALAVFHLCMVAGMVVMFFAIVLRYTGLRAPRTHRVLAYGFLLSWAAIILSGTPLLWAL